jgi:hypothetical protein
MNPPHINVVTRGDLTCHRCGGPAYLAVHIPSKVAHPASSDPTRVELCRGCDIDQPAAQGLLAFLAFHDRITLELAEEFNLLLDEWVRHLQYGQRPSPDPRDFDADIKAWMRGDFD